MNPTSIEAMYEDERIVSELTERDKQAVEKFSRQLSNHSVLSIRSRESTLDDHGHWEAGRQEHDEDFSEEEALRLHNIIQAFQNYKNTTDVDNADSTDGRNYKRLSSSRSFEFLLFSSQPDSSSSRFVSPGRFHVFFSEESKAIVKEVNNMIQRGKNTLGRAQSTEVVVVKNQELSYSYYANQGDHSNVTTHGSHHGLHPEDVDIQMNDHSRYNDWRTFKPKQDGNKIPGGNSMLRTTSGHAIPLSQANGHAQRGSVTLSQLPPREKFRGAVKAVIRLERDKKREEKRKDYFEKFWKRRADVGWFGLLFALIGPFAFITDSATDLKVASDHFSTGHPWWGTFTVMLVFFPAVLMNLVSYFFYKDDEDHAQRSPESGWKIVKITHYLQLGLIERYWRILVKGFKIKFRKPTNVTPYKLYIAMNLDAAMLQMILAFTEDAPQLVLQLYVLIRRKLVEKLLTTSLQDMWTLASICFSFISYSRALVNYISCLRDSKKYKGQLRWYGYIAMWFWRAFMFTSRILVLVFFASEFHLWFFLVLFLHFCTILIMISPHKVNFFPEHKGMQIFIRVVVAYIHLFCFFVLDAKKTIQWAVQYYVLIAVEGVIFSTLWFTNSTHYVSLKFELAGLIAIFLSYGMGLLVMVVYYKFLHPKFKRPQTKWYTKAPPKEELCEDVKNEEEEEEVEESAGNAEQGIHHRENRSVSAVKQIELWL